MSHLFYTREYERGIAEAERIREFAPEFADFVVAWHYMLLGRPEDAAREWLAFYVSGGAAFDPAREAFQRGIDAGGRQGGLRAVRSDAGRVRPRVRDCDSIRRHR